MYIRVNSFSVVRVGRKFSKLSTLLAIMLVSLTFLFLITMISPPEEPAKIAKENEVTYRQENGSEKNSISTSQSHEFSIPLDLKSILQYWKKHTSSLKKKPATKEDDKNKRISELSSWRINQSLLVEDYLDLNDPHSFFLQPSSSIANSLDELSPYCGSDVKLLIMIASAPKNVVSRNAIRETWGDKQILGPRGARLLFMLGRSDNSTLDELVAEESAKYDDIVAEDFQDSYHNLTLKSIAMLKWVNLTCSRNNVTEFPLRILKTDDDIFINMDRLFRIIQEMPNARMIGRLTCGAMPIGDANSKLYMPKYLYPARVYPGYLSGTAYILKSSIIPTLLENTAFVPLLHLEDIYVTGMLARHSNIYADDSAFFTYNKLGIKDDCALRYMVNTHQMTPSEMRTIFQNLKKPPPVPCNLKKAKWLRRVPRLTKRLKTLCLFR